MERIILIFQGISLESGDFWLSPIIWNEKGPKAHLYICLTCVSAGMGGRPAERLEYGFTT